MARFVAYYRVSTAGQGRSGLGLDAQREAVARHVAGAGGRIIAEFMEVESGKRDARPQLAAALAACHAHRATLLVAKLDRLARNVRFIAGLMESGVPFVACDMPNSTPFMLHVYAAVAQEEGRAISARTKAALAAAKDRGVRLALPGQNPGINQHFQCLGYLGRIAQTPEIAGELFVSAQVVLTLPGHSGVRRWPEPASAVRAPDRRDEIGEQARHDGTAHRRQAR